LQSSFKRMMGYSSIAHAGYIIVALVAAGAGGVAAQTGVAAGIMHSLVHMIMAAAAFVAVGMFVVLQVGDDVEDLRGLRTRAPWTARALVLLMFSLIGIPPLLGFWSKYYIGLAAWQAGSWYAWLVLILFINSGYSAYYYLRVIRTVYFQDAPAGAPRLVEPRRYIWLIWALVGFITLVGIYPEPLFVLMRDAADALLALT
jgi:NADH-quinone oxidoreductase subunit N